MSWRFWRNARPGFDRPAPPEVVSLLPIGHVRNRVQRPRPRGWHNVESTIDVLPAYTNCMAGLDAYSHVIVAFYMDLAAAAPEKPSTLTLASGHTYGIFATRSQLRPNHLGVSVVELVSAGETSLVVRGLDAIDGTPVLDIKPYLPEYDSVPAARIPPG